MNKVLLEVEAKQWALREKLEKFSKLHQSLPKENYIKLLSTQYHLNKGVQRHFLIAASHPDLSHRRRLRDFLCKFANEEELHYLIAAKDLEELGVNQPLPCPFDVELWHAYFDKIVYERPFVRLGATTILENALTKSADIFDRLLSNTPYLNNKNMRYIIIHKHEALPHGEEVLSNLAAAKLEEKHLQDLEEGARKGGTLFLRLVDWVLSEPFPN